MTDNQIDETACIEALRHGDESMLAPLFDHYRPRLLKVVSLYMDRSLRSRAEAADVVQESYVDAAQQIDNYISRQDKIDFYVWLRGVIMQRLSKFHRFHLHTRQRAVSRQMALPDQSSLLLGQQLIASGSTPSQHLRKAELREQVERAVQNLADNDREVILMRHFEGLSNQEVAQSLGLEPSAATMRYGRALSRLREALSAVGTKGSSL